MRTVRGVAGRPYDAAWNFLEDELRAEAAIAAEGACAGTVDVGLERALGPHPEPLGELVLQLDRPGEVVAVGAVAVGVDVLAELAGGAARELAGAQRVAEL